MSRLARASAKFDNVSAVDAYTARKLWLCQMGSFESSNPEGATSKRRVLSTAPGLAIPARRAIVVLDETWIVGDSSVDGWKNAPIRLSYWVKKATDLFTYQTPGQAALATGGTAAYASREYLKDTVDAITTADYNPQYDVYFAQGETPVRGGFLRTAENLMRVRVVRDAIAGFKHLSVDDIGLDAEITATFTSSTYNPATDSKSVISVAVPALLFSRVFEYSNATEADPKYLTGDKTLIVSQSSITPTVGQEITAEGKSWKAMQITQVYDAWELHLRLR